MKGLLVTVLACFAVVAVADVKPAGAQFYEPPVASAFSALPGQGIADDVSTKSVEDIDVTLTRAGDPTPIKHFVSAPCPCQYPHLHQLRFEPLPTGLYEIELRARDVKITQELSVTTVGTIAVMDDRKGVVMPVDLRTGRIRHDVALSLRDTSGELPITIGSDGLGHTSALVPGTKTIIAHASDGSVVHQSIVVQRRDEQRSYGYLDRTTYRPGDPAYFTVISRFGTPDVQTMFLVNSASVAVTAATPIYKSSCCISYAFVIPSNTKPGYYELSPTGDTYIEPRSDSDDVDATPLQAHYTVGDDAVFAVSARANSQLRYEIWLQNKAINDVGEANALLTAGTIVVDETGVARISAVVKKQALKVEARLYEPNSTDPIYVASADIVADLVQSELSIPERRIVGQPLPMIARGRPLSAEVLKIYGSGDPKNPLFEDEKRTDANGYALFTWYPSANGDYRAEASQMSSEHPVSRTFAVGVSDGSAPQISSVNAALVMPQTPTVAPGQSNVQLLFAPQGSDALVQWSSGSDFNVNVQKVGPVSRVVVPSSVTSDMVSAAIYGVAHSGPWMLFTSFGIEPQPHRLHISVTPTRRGARIRVTDYRHAPVAARAIVTIRRATPAALLAPFDDDSGYDALYPSGQIYGPAAQLSWWSPGFASGTLATPMPEPTLGPPIPTLPPAPAPTIEPQPQTAYFNPFVETDTSGTAEITFPWSSDDSGRFIISVLAITDDRQIGQAHSIIAPAR